MSLTVITKKEKFYLTSPKLFALHLLIKTAELFGITLAFLFFFNQSLSLFESKYKASYTQLVNALAERDQYKSIASDLATGCNQQIEKPKRLAIGGQ